MMENTIVEDNQIWLIVIPELLRQYKYFINVDYEEEKDSADIHFCRPLCYHPFFQLGKSKLEHLFEKVFKKEPAFNAMLLKMCENQIRHEFLEKVHLLVKNPTSKNRDSKTPKLLKRFSPVAA